MLASACSVALLAALCRLPAAAAEDELAAAGHRALASYTPLEWQAELARSGVRRKVRFKPYDRPPKNATAREKKRHARHTRNVYGRDTALMTFGWFGWVETKNDDWDLLWAFSPQYKFMKRKARLRQHPLPNQSHNHCNMAVLAGNKANLIKHHNEMVREFGRDVYDHIPETYIFPMEREQLLDQMAVAKAEAAGAGAVTPSPLWILKPSLGNRGEGIELLWSPEQLPPVAANETGKGVTIQRYLDQPFLIDGRKVHVRLYVAVTELHPLRLLLFRDGLALFAAKPYSADRSPAALADKRVHLTNAALAKLEAEESGRAAADVTAEEDDLVSGKGRMAWTMAAFLDHVVGLEAAAPGGGGGWDVDATFRAVKAAVVKTVLSAQALRPYPPRHAGGCFSLFGFDVLFDASQKNKPYVLEVNSSPVMYSKTRGINRLVHDRLALHLVSLRSPPPEDVKQQQLARLTPRVQAFAAAQNYSFGPAGRGPAAAAEDGSSPLAAGGCEEPRVELREAVEAIWRLEDEHSRRGLFERLYPTGSAETDRGYDRLWLHNGEPSCRPGTGPSGPATLQRLISDWLRLHPALHEPSGVAAWRAGLAAEDPDLRNLWGREKPIRARGGSGGGGDGIIRGKDGALGRRGRGLSRAQTTAPLTAAASSRAEMEL